MSARVILTYDDYAALPDDGHRYELSRPSGPQELETSRKDAFAEKNSLVTRSSRVVCPRWLRNLGVESP